MRVVLTGRYIADGMRAGSEEVAVAVFHEMQTHLETYFVTKYSILKPHSIWQKFFGFKQEGNLYYAGFFRIPFLIRKLNPDIVHAINYDSFVGMLFWWLGGRRAKLCYTVHGVVRYETTQKLRIGIVYKWKSELFEKLVFKYSDSVFFYNNRIKTLAGKYFSSKNFSSKIMLNSISVNYGILKNRQRSSKDFSAKKLIIVAMGGWPDRARGAEYFLDSMTGTAIDFELHYLGEAEELVVPYQHRGKVKLRGKLAYEELFELLEDAHLYLCLSYYESFPVTATEAMCAGVVVLTFPNTGISDHITNGVDGFIVSYENPKELVEVISKISGDREYLRQCSQSATTISEKLNWPVAVNNYMLLYNELYAR